MSIDHFSPETNRNEVTSFIDDVEQELNGASDVYEKQLVGLFEKIREIKPSTIFFIDRSARPVAWMLKEMWDFLKKSDAIHDGAQLPDIRFISLDIEHPPTKEASSEAQKRYSFDKSRPVLVVDEFSESFNGRRGVDFAKKILKQQLGADRVKTHVFMDRMEVGGIPMFYRIPDSVKEQVYGIQDTNNDSMISKRASRNSEISDEVKRYRSLFKDFGEKAAKEYVKTRTN